MITVMNHSVIITVINHSVIITVINHSVIITVINPSVIITIIKKRYGMYHSPKLLISGYGYYDGEIRFCCH